MGKRGRPRKDKADSGRPSPIHGGREMKSSLGISTRTRSKAALTTAPAAAAPIMENYREATRSQVSITPIASPRPFPVLGRNWTAMRAVQPCSKASETVEQEEEEEMSLPTEEQIKKFIAEKDKPLSLDDDIQGTHDKVTHDMQDNPLNYSGDHIPEQDAPLMLSEYVEDADEGSNVIGTPRVDSDGSPPKSLGITQMAAMLDNNVADPDEVDSLTYPNSVSVDGYQVKEEYGPKLRDIFSKYGNIASQSQFNGKVCSIFLEMVCSVVMKLEQSCLQTLAYSELKSMLEDIRAAKAIGLNVGWLQERAEMIKKAWLLFTGTVSLKKEKMKSREEVEKKEAELVKIEQERAMLGQELLKLDQKLSSGKEELAGMKVQCEKIIEKEAQTKSTVKCFLEGSLAQGLL